MRLAATRMMDLDMSEALPTSLHSSLDGILLRQTTLTAVIVFTVRYCRRVTNGSEHTVIKDRNVEHTIRHRK